MVRVKPYLAYMLQMLHIFDENKVSKSMSMSSRNGITRISLTINNTKEKTKESRDDFWILEHESWAGHLHKSRGRSPLFSLRT